MQFAQKCEVMNLDILRINRLLLTSRASLNRDEDELVYDSLEDRPVQDTNDPETPHSLMEPEFERGNTPPKTRPRSSEELLNDGPIALRRRVEVPPQQLRSHAWRVTGRSGSLDYRSLEPQWYC